MEKQNNFYMREEEFNLQLRKLDDMRLESSKALGIWKEKVLESENIRFKLEHDIEQNRVFIQDYERQILGMGNQIGQYQDKIARLEFFEGEVAKHMNEI